MRVAAPSADLLIKLALAAAVVGAVVWAARKAASTVPGLVSDAADAINPFNNNNVFASGANSVTSSIAGRPETFGGWLRSATSNDDERIEAMLHASAPPTPAAAAPIDFYAPGSGDIGIGATY